MGALENTNLTVSEFIEWTDTQGDKVFELEYGLPYQMAAEQARHALTKFAAAEALKQVVEKAGLDCHVFPDGMQIIVDDETVRVPDAVVQCAPFDPDSSVLEKPVILVEVISPSSANRDEKHKLVEYFSIPSVQHYLILYAEKHRLVHISKGTDDGKLATQMLTGGSLELAPPGIELDVDDLFGIVGS